VTIHANSYKDLYGNIQPGSITLGPGSATVLVLTGSSPTATPTSTPAPLPTPTNTPVPTPTPTPTPNNTPIPTLTNTPTPTNTPVPTPTPTNTPTATTTNTPIPTPTPTATGHALKTVFVILMENHNWSSIVGNTAEAPYLNSLLTGAQTSYATQYYNPPGTHPSLPNYLWLEGGQCFSYCGTDNSPSYSPNGISSGATLHHLLSAAGISWREYAENITDGSCPMTDNYPYAPKHNPFVYFNDVNGSSSACSAHEKNYADLSGDLATNTVARYNVITPNMCDDMHDSCSPINDAILQGDKWLSTAVPQILSSPAYLNGGALLITWDEGEGGDGPIGMIVLSPDAKGSGYATSIHYTHSSTLRTLEEIYGVSPMEGDAATATDLADLFRTFP
jgi:hypothetical protein